MKKLLSLNMVLVLSLLCGCAGNRENREETRLLFDTVVTLSAPCSRETLDGAFSLCEKYEEIFSATNKKSELYRLNSSGSGEVSDELLSVLKTALYYCELTGGRYDITIEPVSALYNFEGTSLPDRKEIAEALKNVDYEAISINGSSVNLNGKRITLGSIAKGYIGERVAEYFKEQGVKKAVINIGGNVHILGEAVSVGIKNPLGEGSISKVNVSNMNVVTAGTYERFIEVGGVRYHHILDTATGYGIQSDIVSASIIGKGGEHCDAISTVCIIYGLKEATQLIENTDGFEAIFVDANGKTYTTSGLQKKNGVFII